MGHDFIDERIQSAVAGDNSALAELFEHYQGRLRRMVDLRIDRRVQKRVSTSDVLQEAYVDLAGQLANYARDPKLPFFIWMRRLVGQRLAKTHRQHLGAEKRNAAMEVSLFRGRMPQATSFALASKLVGRFTSAEEKVERAERQIKLQEILNRLEPDDREVLAMRHFEDLSTVEVAAILDISEAAARMRFLRALKKLKAELGADIELFNMNQGDP